MGLGLLCAGAAIAVCVLVAAMAHDREVARHASQVRLVPVPTRRAPTPTPVVPQDPDELWLEKFCSADTIISPPPAIAPTRVQSEPTVVDASAYDDDRAHRWLSRRPSEATTSTGAPAYRAATPSW